MDDFTYFASAKRDPRDMVYLNYQEIKNNDYLTEILDAMPDIAAVLNEHRQIIYGNESLLGFLQLIDQNDLLGLRPGEVFNCVNSRLNSGGCGTSENCKYCGAVNAILESQQGVKKVAKECRITTQTDDSTEYLDLIVTATPFVFRSKTYTILSIKDISNQKRRQILERIFFHDILNIAGSIKGFADVLKSTRSTESEIHDKDVLEYIDVMGQLSNELLDEIISQRTLLSAESGDLHINISRISSEIILKDTTSYLSINGFSESKKTRIAADSENVFFDTDVTLLKRVIINMLKNALEASFIDQAVVLSSKKFDKYVEFSVHNEGVMPPEVQAQVFQRSFSTKGTDRGIGTYSIKLLTERYLLGSVGFVSEKDKGTTFFIQIPL
ncbi:MAG: ATP-binding protein [Bacteroidales bacterium]